jgi:hypothetical protein
MGQKNLKKISSSRVPCPSTRGRDPSPSAIVRHSGKRHASPSARVWHSGKISSIQCRFIPPSNGSFFRLPLFPECLASPSVMHFSTLGKDSLPRVSNIWHSGKHVTLGKFGFSRSEFPRFMFWFTNQGSRESSVWGPEVF